MRKLLVFALTCLLLGSAQVASADDPFEDGKSCKTFGTTVQFVKTPSLAAQRAAKEEKLVFVLHVSGKFEDPQFT
ncbi:MAG: hypothetical protein ACFCD0_02140 [Gemmataceae bacterium]